MQRIRNFVDRFIKEKGENKNYSIKTGDIIAFMNEIRESKIELFYTISLLFRFGYAKGYRACKAEQKKARKAA